MRIQQKCTIEIAAIALLMTMVFGGRGEAQETSQTQPGLAQEYYREGLFYGKQGKYVEAIVALEKAIALHPANADAYNALGVVYHRQNQTAKAQEYYLLAVEADPNHAKARTNLAMAYSDLQQYDKAVRQLKQALKSRPDYRPAVKLLEKLNKQSSEQAAKERDRQQKEAQKASLPERPAPAAKKKQSVTNPIKPIFRSGTMLALDGELDAAIQTYRRGLSREPRSAEGYALLAMAYREKFRQSGEQRWRQHEVKAFATALQYQPESVLALLGLGEIYYEQGKFTTAYSYFEKALQAQPAYPAREQLIRILQQ